ncbi:hypothetical protein KXV52_002908 [Aspergillus fumigatus]|nr:hypothetical protein KXV88_001969 [Aspergillus fumigatus]KAH2212746.1 hypothetical protein KXV58_009007 [Aspergillus fumigatus]KAH2761951.1 hypothetical protein KXV66_008701 [Aspergillus fumigatus]KAH3367124.1 hypothetical protein KXV52_002908 [Aspergillus fumigatus]KAH3374971.1 hypothetical protein KXW99_006639 [Aspergillus fumigatus]
MENSMHPVQQEPTEKAMDSTQNTEKARDPESQTGKTTNEVSPGSEENQEASSGRPSMSGLRLNIVVFGLWISLFLAALDSTIISTALFDISNSLNETSKSAWVVTSYLLTYNAFVLLIAKLSDLVGLKPLLLGSNLVFLVFSIASGVARTIDQLIVFRAFQGIGASGLYCLVFVAILQLISLEKAGLYSGVISSVFALSNLLGPILGGVIVDNTTWRWIFYINIPFAAIATVLLGVAIPVSDDIRFNRQAFKRLDYVGSFLSICWLIPLLFALQEGGTYYAWDSSEVIGTLVGGIVALIVFLAYEAWLQRRRDSAREPIFPIRFVRDPLQGLLLLNVLFTGFAFYTSIINLPQRFQAVNEVSASRAGVLLLTMTLILPFFSLVAGALTAKAPQTAFTLLTFGTVLVLTSTACFSVLPDDHAVADRQYGFEVLMGAGLGIISTTQYVILKMTFPARDMAAGTGAMNMLRAMGGCIGLAICAAMLSSRLDDELAAVLPGRSPDQIQLAKNSLHGETNGFSAEEIAGVRRVYGRGYNDGFQVMIAFAGANVVVAGLLFLATCRRGGIGRVVADAKAAEARRPAAGISSPRSAITFTLREFASSSRDKQSIPSARESPRDLPTSGYEHIDAGRLVEEEELLDYRADRFYPVHLGEVFRDRYQAIAKLGFGSSSTTWLARDLEARQYVALKVYVRTSLVHRELPSYHHIASRMKDSTHEGRGNVRRLLDSFVANGPDGDHVVLVFEPAQMSLRDMKVVFRPEGFDEDFVRGAIIELLKALDFLHTHGEIVHTGICPVDQSPLERRPHGVGPSGAKEIIAALGPPPVEFLAKTPERRADFWDDEGKWLGLAPIPEARTMEALECRLKDKAGFLSFIRRALTWMPEERATAKELLQDPWLSGRSR